MSTPDWTIYEDREFIDRVAIVTDYLIAINVPQNKYLSDTELDLEVQSWARALELVPTDLLGYCLKRANENYAESYPMTAGYVKSVWKEVQEEITSGWDDPHEAAKPGQAALSPGRPAIGDADEDYSVLHNLTEAEWKMLHSLPDDFKRGDPYPAGHPLQGKVVPVLPSERAMAAESKEHDYDFAGPYWPLKWYRRSKAPWEIYPDIEHAETSMVVVQRKTIGPHGHETITSERVEYVRWVDRCVEMEHPANICPGYIELHHGPGGDWTKRLQCPFHGARWDRLPR